MSPFTSVASRRTSDQIIEQIRSAITAGRFADDERLPSERELAETFEVSRGVIREAVKVLNGMGLIESRQGSGLYVRNNPAPVISRALTLSLERDERQVHQLYDIRRALETLAAARAAAHYSPEHLAAIRRFATAMPDSVPPEDTLTVAANDDAGFHLAIAQATDNPYLVVLIQAVQGLIATTFPMTEGQREGAANARETHARIADAIAVGDAETAALLLGHHIDRSRETVNQFLHTSDTDASEAI